MPPRPQRYRIVYDNGIRGGAWVWAELLSVIHDRLHLDARGGAPMPVRVERE